MINEVLDNGSVLTLGALMVDSRSYRAFLNNRRLDLTVSELRALAILLANTGRVISREELSEGLGLSGARSVDALLSALRKHLGPRAIRNVRKRGWMLDPAHLGE